MSLVMAPEDVALYDPEDDRADYAALCESVELVDVSALYAAFWPESVGV